MGFRSVFILFIFFALSLVQVHEFSHTNSENCNVCELRSHTPFAAASEPLVFLAPEFVELVLKIPAPVFITQVSILSVRARGPPALS